LAEDVVAASAARPLVSVVVPAYNAAWSLDETLASVCAQTYPDIEVLVVDDGSTDATAEVAAAWSHRDPRVRLICKPNGGVGSARNLGMRKARGVYVAPIDADDLWEPDHLERQVAALEAAGPEACMAFAHSVFVDMDNRPLAAAVWCPWESRTESPKPPETDFRGLLLRNSVANGSAAVFRRDRMLEVGGYDESLRAAGADGVEDWKLTLTLATRGRVLFVPAPTVRYRMSSSSLSRNIPAMRRGVAMVIDYARRHGPRLAPWNYWHARTLMLVWMLPRAVRSGQWRQVLGLTVGAYVLNPLWWVNPEPWTFIWRTCTTGVAEALGLGRRAAQRR
jgi:glycosyltransferase involved in cell wall biosynthesis